MGLGPGGEDPRLLDWAARGGRRLLGLRTPASHRPGSLWPLCAPSVTLTLLGVSEQGRPSETEWGFLRPRRW